MNRILLFALCALLCSCSQNKEKEAETALFEQIRQDYVEMKNIIAQSWRKRTVRLTFMSEKAKK